MNEGLIPKRYAKALLKVAQQRNLQQQLYKIMTILADSFVSNAQLGQTIDNPFVQADKKILLLTTAAGLEHGASDESVLNLFEDFLKLLQQNRRINIIRDVALAYQQIYREVNKISVVEITSATKLNSAEVDRLKSIILSHLPNGTVIELKTGVNPDLIGGFTISIDNERLDASVRNELKQLRLKIS